MAIRKREDLINTNKRQVWELAESKAGKMLNFGVDGVTGDYLERFQWVLGQRIKKKSFFVMNSVVFFFENENDAVHYYLRWGR